MANFRVIVADDHPLFRAALRQAVQRSLPEAEISEVADMRELEEAAATEPAADLVLLDLRMPGAHGFSSLIFLRKKYPEIPVVVISAADDARTSRRAADFDAAGFLSKSAPLDDICSAIDTVLAGGTQFPDNLEEAPDDSELIERLASLTPQQFRVLMMLAEGLLNKQIAYELGVSEATIKAHMTAIMRKLNIYSRTQAALIAHQLNVEDLPNGDTDD